jgi:hypothetical protein
MIGPQQHDPEILLGNRKLLPTLESPFLIRSHLSSLDHRPLGRPHKVAIKYGRYRTITLPNRRRLKIYRPHQRHHAAAKEIEPMEAR